MQNLKKILFTFSFLIFGMSIFNTTNAVESEKIDLYFFYGDGCPHCHKEAEFLEKLKKEDQNLLIHKYEVWHDSENAKLLAKISKKLELQSSGVPILIIGDKHLIGFHSEFTTGSKIRKIIADYQIMRCQDTVGKIILNQDNKCSHNCNKGNTECPQDCGCENNNLIKPKEKLKNVNIPFLGEINLGDYSLGLLTVIIAALDGFNPCAMWILLFLISLLINMENRTKMWILGGSFIFTSGIVYFLFLAAWLNVFLFVGMITWIQKIIGIVAFGSGIYHLREYFINKDGTCHVTDSKKRKKVFNRIRGVILERNFYISLIGIILLAISVNLVELVCSAGLPAIYTQVLAISGLAPWQYYGYLALYILIFMLDDLLIFAIAMATLKMHGISSKYTRISNLIGGIIMLIIGLALIFKPELLMFG